MCRGNLVAIRKLKLKTVEQNKEVLREFREVCYILCFYRASLMKNPDILTAKIITCFLLPKLVFMKYNVLNIKHLLPEKLATIMELKNHLYIFTQAL